jgi:uncharacterized protein
VKIPKFLRLVLITLAVATIPAMLSAQSPRPANDRDHQLVEAVRSGDLAKASVLLSNGADIDTRVENDKTPLMLSAASNNFAMVKLLLEKGADAEAKDQQGETVLVQAARSFAGAEVVGMLAENTSNPKEKEEALFAVLSGMGAVVIGIASDNANKVTENQTRKLQPETADAPGVQTVKLLLDKGVPVDSRDDESSTPLIMAAGYGETEIVRFLLARGADFRARNKYGLSPLMAASCQCALSTMNGTYDIVKILLEKGAAVNLRNHEGETALMLASGMAGDPAVLKLLLDDGADPALKDKHGDTALSLAIKSYREDKVQVLKRAPAHAH